MYFRFTIHYKFNKMNIAYTILVHVVWILSIYFVIVFILVLLKNKDKLYEFPALGKRKLPKVSIIVPAYNEEETIANSIESLKSIDYPENLYEIIIVNDGSKDDTSRVVLRHMDDKRAVLIDNKKNKGKAACLNQGISIAKGMYVACMDSDSEVSPDILKKTIPYFDDPKIGAVTVSVQVKAARNSLQKIIQLEYLLGLSLFLKIFSFFNCVHVTPGPFSIYRRRLLEKINGFDTRNITEDLEIAYRIHKSGYKIANCMSTHVKTIIPHNLKSLYRQRKRWYSGALKTLWQHRGILLTKRAGLFRFFIPFNYALITSGLALFLFSLYLSFSNIMKNILMHSLTNYNFFSHWEWNFDALTISIFSFFGFSGLLFTIVLITLAINLTRNKLTKNLQLYFGNFLLFFMYQFFWLASYITVLSRRKLKWR